MKKVIIAAIAALFAFAVNAAQQPAANQQAPAAAPYTAEQCKNAMADAKTDEAKAKLKAEHPEC